MDGETRKLIMLIEDDSNMVGLLRESLQASGFNVLAYYSVEEAIRVLRHRRPDLIILDIIMPGMNGMTFLKMIKTEVKPRIPILVHSGISDPEKIIADESVDAFVPKGLNASILINVIRQLLSNAAAEAAESTPTEPAT